MPKKTDLTDRLIGFVISHLPDSIQERRGILESLVATFPNDDEPRALLSSLDSHLGDQREMAFITDGRQAALDHARAKADAAELAEQEATTFANQDTRSAAPEPTTN